MVINDPGLGPIGAPATPMRIVVVGPGLIGKQHLRLVGARDDCELLAIVAPDHEANRVVAREYAVPIFHDLGECIARHQVDGVIISSPNGFHAEQAKLCIEARIPVLVEKPVTDSVDAGEELVALVELHDAKVLVGHHRAHSPLLAKAREVIGSGRIGRLVSVMGSAQFYKPESYFKAGLWRTQPGGGPILINLIHEMGNLRTLCGEIAAVQAISSSAIRDHEVEDTVAINLEFTNGALGTFMLSDTAACAMSWEQTARENPSYPSYADEDCYVIAGTKGSLSVPTMRLKYYPDSVEPSWWTPFAEEQISVERADPLSCQLAHFVGVMRGEALPLVSAADGLMNLKVTQAIAQSAVEKKLIYL